MRRKRVMLVSCAVITICALLYHFTRPPDPVYEGRKLSEWLEDLDPKTSEPPDYYPFISLWNENNQKHDRAVIAIQHIGTNALPYLKARISERPGGFFSILPKALARQLVSDEEQAEFRQEARKRKHPCLFACYVLGPKAGELTPTILEHINADGGSGAIWSVFPQLGSTAVPYLIQMLSMTNQGSTWTALQLLTEIGPDASAAIPKVIPLLNDPNDVLCGEAAFTLVSITDDPEETINPLLKLLNSTNDHIHARIAEAMYSWDSSGEKAAPALLRLAASTNSHVQTPATIALVKVAPDLATNILDQLKQIALMNYWHGYRAREILTSMGTQAKPVVDDLLHAAITANHDKNSTLAIAVISIDPDKGKSLIPRLMQKLHGEDNPSEEKVAALKALSLLGAVAEPALPLIKSLLLNNQPQVRTAATNALHAITSAPSAVSTRATPP